MGRSTSLGKTSSTRVAQAEGKPRPSRSSATDLSVVVAVYGCLDCLRALHERLVRTLDGLVDSFEIVFVDDASPDGSWDLIAELAADDPRVRALQRSGHFGHHAAITAGLARRRGLRARVS